MDAAAMDVVETEVYPELLSLDHTGRPAEFPIEALIPFGLDGFVSACEQVYRASPALSATAALAVVSAAASLRYRAPMYEGGEQPIGLFAWLLADSGRRKSSVINRAKGVFHDWAAQQEAAIAEEKKAWEARKKAHEGDEPFDEPKPTFEYPIIDDPTIEALGGVLQNTGGFGLLVNGEADSLLGNYSFSEHRKPRSQSTLIRMWDGDQRMGQQRIEGKNYIIPDPRLTMLVGGRPEGMLAACFGDVANGFSARVILAEATERPEQGRAPTQVRTLANDKVREYEGRVLAILNSVPTEKVGNWPVGMVLLDAEGEADALLEEHVAEVSKDAIQIEGNDKDLASRLERSAQMVLRIAAALACLRDVSVGKSPRIDGEAMGNALAIERWALAEFRRLSPRAGRSNVIEQATHWMELLARTNLGTHPKSKAELMKGRPLPLRKDEFLAEEVWTLLLTNNNLVDVGITNRNGNSKYLIHREHPLRRKT